MLFLLTQVIAVSSLYGNRGLIPVPLLVEKCQVNVAYDDYQAVKYYTETHQWMKIWSKVIEAIGNVNVGKEDEVDVRKWMKFEAERWCGLM